MVFCVFFSRSVRWPLHQGSWRTCQVLRALRGWSGWPRQRRKDLRVAKVPSSLGRLVRLTPVTALALRKQHPRRAPCGKPCHQWSSWQQEHWFLLLKKISMYIGLFATSLNMADCKALWEAWSPKKPFARQEIWVKTLLTNTAKFCQLVSRVRGTIKLSIKSVSWMWTDYKVIPLLVRCGGQPAQKSTWCGLFGLLQSHNALPSTCAWAFPW